MVTDFLTDKFSLTVHHVLAGHHHVHFPEDVGANTEIQMRMKGESIVNVHLGFLQHKHKYEVQFTVPISPGSTSLTPVINTPFIAVGNVNSLGEFTVELKCIQSQCSVNNNCLCVW